MMLPVIHSNGSSPESLLDGYDAAYDAVCRARMALGGVEVNGRDYYPHGDYAATAASQEHRARLEALANIEHDFELIISHIRNIMDERNARRKM